MVASPGQSQSYSHGSQFIVLFQPLCQMMCPNDGFVVGDHSSLTELFTLSIHPYVNSSLPPSPLRIFSHLFEQLLQYAVSTAEDMQLTR